MDSIRLSVKSRMVGSELQEVRIESTHSDLLHNIFRNIPVDEDTQASLERLIYNIRVIVPSDRRETIDSCVLTAAIAHGATVTIKEDGQ